MMTGVNISVKTTGDAFQSTKAYAQPKTPLVSSSISTPESVITIERGTGVYETYMRNGVIKKMQYVGTQQA